MLLMSCRGVCWLFPDGAHLQPLARLIRSEILGECHWRCSCDRSCRRFELLSIETPTLFLFCGPLLSDCLADNLCASSILLFRGDTGGCLSVMQVWRMTTGKSMDRDDISLRVLSSATTQGLTPGTATTFRLEYREFDRSGPFSAESLGWIRSKSAASSLSNNGGTGGQAVRCPRDLHTVRVRK